MSEDLGHLSDREILILVHRDVSELKEAKTDHESRLRVVERLSAIATGGVAVLSGIGSWIRFHAK